MQQPRDLKNMWPCPGYNVEEEPHFLFIVTPPYSGSTAFAQLLNSSHGSAFLHAKGEGQWLIPGLCDEDRWDQKKIINWESVRSVWMYRIGTIKGLVQNVELIIEKSPPNLVRIDQLVKVFPSHSLLAFNRNPYASCSSALYRLYDPDKNGEAQRIKIISKIASDWLLRSSWIKKWIDEFNIDSLSYEKFCAEPAACITGLAETIPALKTVDIRKSIKVKDYDVQRIVNFNELQIQKLNKQEIDAISEALAKNIELVSSFDYDIL